MRPKLAAVVLAALALTLAGCGGSSTATELPGPTTAAAAQRTQAVIDVRTPEEYGSGHVEGAVNIDVLASDFEARVAELDANVRYVVYCRSGNRAAEAAERMRARGLDAENGGGLDDMLAAGWPAAG